ncbi:MAG: hypothetical protein ACOCYV_02500 [Planctomycetota bacterium]
MSGPGNWAAWDETDRERSRAIRRAAAPPEDPATARRRPPWWTALLGATPAMLLAMVLVPFATDPRVHPVWTGAWVAIPIALIGGALQHWAARSPTFHALMGVVLGSLLRLTAIVAFCLVLRGLAVGGAALAVVTMTGSLVAGLLIETMMLVRAPGVDGDNGGGRGTDAPD